MPRTKKKSLLDDDDDAGDAGALSIKVNEGYAKRFEVRIQYYLNAIVVFIAPG